MDKVRWKLKARNWGAMVFILVFAWAFLADAQEGEDQPDYESSEKFEESKEEFGKKDERPPVSIRLWKDDEFPGSETGAGWGGWGGPMVGFVNLDLSALDPMTDDRGISSFDENLVTVGGLGGMAYSDPDKQGWWRFGGMGFGVDLSESKRVAGQNRYAEMSLSGGGVFLEYHHPLGSRVDAAIGAMVGAGTLELRAEGDDLGIVSITGDDDWSATESFFMGYPYAGLSCKVLDWMRVEATAGYLLMEADLSGTDYIIDDSGMEMTDGDIMGGPQYALRVVFGSQWKQPVEGEK
jgi:hypothetical protein